MSGPPIDFPSFRLSVDQAVQKVQHVGFGCDDLSQGHFHGDQHGLFVVMQNQRQDIDHLSVTAGTTQHDVLQLLEGWREFRKGRTVPQCTGLAVKDGQVMPPIVDREWWELVAALDHSHMFTQDLTLGSDPSVPIRVRHLTG